MRRVMLLSVVVPVYNVREYVGATIRSLASQTSSDYEVIIVDDGSTDGSHAVIERELEAAAFPYQVVRQPNHGVSVARNVGLASARGEYVLFLDGDDLVAPNLVEELSAAVSLGSPDVVCWGFERVAPDHGDPRLHGDTGRTGGWTVSTGPEALRRMAVTGALRICTNSIAYSKEFLTKQGRTYSEGCASGEDREFIITSVGSSESVLIMDSTLSYWVNRPDSITNRFDIRRFDAVKALERAFYSLSANPSRDVCEIAQVAGDRAILDHYFYNLRSCICNDWEQGRKLFAELDGAYPGLRSEIETRLRARRWLSTSSRIYLRSFSGYRYYTYLGCVARRIAQKSVRRIRIVFG